jgi:hypothetical protein
MLVKDTPLTKRWRVSEARERAKEIRQRALLQELANHQVTVAPDDGKDITDRQRQMGRMLTAKQVQDKLKLCNPRLYFEVSKSDSSKLGVYIEDPNGGYVTLYGKVRFICGMESGISPEFTVIHTCKTQVPDQDALGQAVGRELKWKWIDTYLDQTRGWWTVLGRLVAEGIIRMADVEKHFGFPSRDSARWAAKFR